MQLTFLGTGGAWSLPELNCGCMICREMKRRREKRQRTALLLSGNTDLLIDCGPDIADQLSKYGNGCPGAVLITHEHGDHYMGLDELVSFKRTAPRGSFSPIPVFMTAASWEVIRARFAYLSDMGVIQVHVLQPLKSVRMNEFEITPFKTRHSTSATGSVGYCIRTGPGPGSPFTLVYTSDFIELPEMPSLVLKPDVLIIQSFWLNEPAENRPRHMSFQRALDFIRRFNPRRETFLVHIGDGDPVPGDPANTMLKKRAPRDPLCPPECDDPYPIPLHQNAWQSTVDRILADRHIRRKITVAHDGLRVRLST